MLPTRLDRLLSLGAGCCVLWLMTAQQKLCPWLHDETPAEHAAHAAPQPADESADEESQKTESPRLPLLLPDSRYTAAPRGPAGSRQAAAHQAAGWRDGVRVAGPRHGDTDEQQPLEADVAPDWRRWQIALPYGGPACATAPPATLRDPALHTCILRNGPPRTCA